MPFYDYKCNTCGKTLEIQHSILESKKNFCTKETCINGTPERGTLELIFNKPNLVFKGSGFYESDYKSKNNN